MINGIIAWSLRNRFLVACGVLSLIAWGVHSIYRTPVDAIPDLSENQVIVFADWPGRSPQEVEDQITYPLSVNLQGLAGVKTVRASSMFGFTFMTIIFEENIDNYFARSRVLERLSYLEDKLPSGVVPKLGPDATGLGWVYQYYLAVDPLKAPKGGYDLSQLRALQDWFIRYQLNALPGVAEVGSVGGFVRQYQVEVSPRRMRTAQVSLQEVLDAIQQSNLNVGGKVIEENGMEFVVRGVGLIGSVADLENIVLKESAGTPIYLRDVSTIQLGGEFRRGALDVNGQEVVGGVVVMRNGENGLAVIRQVKEKIARLQPSLPPGVQIKPFYDRSTLIERTLATLKRALGEEILLVALAHIIFLWHFRSILIVTLPLPVSILISFILMRQFGITSNIMSLSGIAIAIGVLVDAGIVMTENVIRHCERLEAKKGGGVRLTPAETWEATLEAAQQVGRPIFFAMLIIILAFIPVFTLVGQEGKLFHPLAFTKTFAMIGATLLAVTFVPALCTVLVRGPFRPEAENAIMKRLLRLYDPALSWALTHRRVVLGSAAGLLAIAGVLAFGLPRPVARTLEAWHCPRAAKVAQGMGSEFMPALNEGSLLFMPVLLPSTSLTEIKRLISWQDQVLKQVPEVQSAAGKLGRSETATDPAPVEMIETTIELKPESQWRPGMTQEKLIAELTSKLSQAPGYVPGFLRPIEGRILMLSTGIRAQVGVKILGDNLDALQKKAFEVEKVMRQVPGAVGVAPSRLQGKPYLNIEVDRVAMARYGLRAQTVLDAVETGLGGKNVTTTIEGRQRFPIQVRFQQDERDEIERLGDVLVFAPGGKTIPLGQVAKVKRVLGPSEITSENGRLRLFVQANVQGRDLGGFVKEARERIEREVRLGQGMTIEWSGQYENQLRAQHTLQLIIPTVLAIIFVLLYMVYHSAKEAAHVILAVPFALTGGVFLQYLLGFNFSVAVWVGYIALFGTAIQTAIVMVVYLEEALQRKRAERGAAFNHADLIQAVKDGARLRLRPKVMTVATCVAGLLPIMWSTSTGSEVMRPLATPVIGGMLSSFLHILIVTPVLFAWLREREMSRRPAPTRRAGPAETLGTRNSAPRARSREKVPAQVVACLALLMGATALSAGPSHNPYQAIVERNVFGLKPPAPPAETEPPKPEPPPITLTGITTFGTKRALMILHAVPGRTGADARPQPLVLAEGQREAGLEVLEIDAQAHIVTVNNSGVILTLTFKDNGPKPAPAPKAGLGAALAWAGNPVPAPDPGMRPLAAAALALPRAPSASGVGMNAPFTPTRIAAGNVVPATWRRALRPAVPQ
jgi:copper/silver efflux system protein